MIEFRRASVQVGDVETSYRRAGHGAPLLLLVAPPIEPSVLDQLGSTRRLLIPDATSILALCRHAAHSVFGAWLRDFLDGLGVMQVTLVAPRLLEEELDRFMAEAPEYVRRVLWVGEGPVDWQAIVNRLERD